MAGRFRGLVALCASVACLVAFLAGCDSQEPGATVVDSVVQHLEHVDTFEGGRHLFEGSVKLRRTGPFGYTVRVLPKNPALASKAELGLIANA